MKYIRVYFFLLIMFSLPGIVLLASVPTRTQSQAAPSEITNTKGVYVSFGPAGTPNASWDTAEELLTALSDPKRGIEAKGIDRWKNGGWDSHLRGLPFNNFTITVGHGYLINFNKYPSRNFANNLSYEKVRQQKYEIYPAWNMFSVPDISQKYNAEDLCVETKRAGLDITEINEHPDRTASDFWNKHSCGSKENNFSILTGRGYFMLNNEGVSASLTLPSSRR